MASRISRALQASWERSPRENWAALWAKRPGARGNQVVPRWWTQPASRRLLAAAVERLAEPVALVGGEEAEVLASLLEDSKHSAVHVDWSWHSPPERCEIPVGARIVLCRVATSDEEWRSAARWKQQHPGRVLGIQELLLPLTLVDLARARLGYFTQDPSELADYFVGRHRLGALDALAERLPLAGLSVIEFGPLDGAQTAGLVALGARQVTCVEARAENAIKTLVAREALGWSGVRLAMDDFHNADAARYGRFDLVVAHGVYYHSVAPFLFLENLLTLSDRIFVGGYCATNSLPRGHWEWLRHADGRYRAKRYRESSSFTAGVNAHGYFFHPDDLVRFFEERECDVEILTQESCHETAGSYLRFLATRRGVSAD